MRNVLVAISAVAFLAGPVNGLAQGRPDPDRSLCWRSGTPAGCANFLVTEFSFAVGPKAPSRRPPVNGVWELGVMHSLGPSHLVGVSAFVLHDDESRYLLGLRPRGRYWMGDAVSIDLGLGVILHGMRNETFVVQVPSVTGKMGVTWYNRFGLFAQLEVLSVEDSPFANPDLVGVQSTLYVGVSFGAEAGVIAGLVGGGLIHWANRGS